LNSFVGYSLLWQNGTMVRAPVRAVALTLGLPALAAASCRSEARPPSEIVIPLVATAEVKGTTEPCGCNSDPLGDVARLARLAEGGLLLDGGSLLYDPETLTPVKQPQADAKASTLATIYARGAVGLGPDDLTRGPARVEPPRQAANVSGVATAPPRIFDLRGVKIGVFGVVAPERVPSLQTTDPVAAARLALATLRKDGAQVVVALAQMSRSSAHDLLAAVDGISFAVVGAEVGEGMPEAEPVGRAFLVAPADQGRRAARIELHVRGGQVALTPFGGEAARALGLERTRRKIATLTLELARWKSDPTADAAFVKARQAELDKLVSDEKRLSSEKPTPPAGSYFTYSLEPIRRALPRDQKVADQLRQLDRQIGAANLKAAQSIAPPPPEPGKPSYVGMSACAKCHKPAVEFWQKTVHASAWRTLVSVDKQYNYDCTGCHVTGWQKPGGTNLASVEKAGLVDVQCEVCHGPGSRHVKEAGLEEPKTLTRRPPDRFCADNCHTKEHSDTFALEPYLRDILGKGHGEKLRAQLGEGVTGHELRQKALAASK
jgi:hypothetical protein